MLGFFKVVVILVVIYAANAEFDELKRKNHHGVHQHRSHHVSEDPERHHPRHKYHHRHEVGQDILRRLGRKSDVFNWNINNADEDEEDGKKKKKNKNKGKGKGKGKSTTPSPKKKAEDTASHSGSASIHQGPESGVGMEDPASEPIKEPEPTTPVPEVVTKPPREKDPVFYAAEPM